MKQLEIVLDNYLSSRAQNSRAFAPNTPEQHAIATEIPKFFTDALVAYDFSPDDYKIEGSYGAGNMALCPWVAIFDRRITTTAQQGYYVVLLFAEDMKSCYLSLNQGYTSYTQIYASDRIARRKARETALQALRHIDTPSHAMKGRIDLATEGVLGRGYEDCSILSFRYDVTTLPQPERVKDDLHILLVAYRRLFERFGNALHEILPATESDFQLDANEAARRAPELNKEATFVEGPEPVSQPSSPTAGIGPRYRRDPHKAALAFLAADFKCEVDPTHATFTSRRTTRQYVEAHHLVPMKEQGSSPFSLDVRANIIALCPTCHRLLHHGPSKEKKPILMSLFDKRRVALTTKGIDVTFQALVAMYSGDICDDD